MANGDVKNSIEQGLLKEYSSELEDKKIFNDLTKRLQELNMFRNESFFLAYQNLSNTMVFPKAPEDYRNDQREFKAWFEDEKDASLWQGEFVKGQKDGRCVRISPKE